MIRLEQNYRSSEVIVAAANSVIVQNTLRQKKRLWTAQKGGENVVVCECRNGACELAYVASELKRRYAAGTPWSDMAVLFRTNSTGALFKDSLRASGIPVRLANEQMYSPLEIEDLLAFIRLTVNEGDDISFKRVAKVLRITFKQELFDSLKKAACDGRVGLLHAARQLLSRSGSRKLDAKDARELNRVVDCQTSLSNRAGELGLSVFIKRVVWFFSDCYVLWKRQAKRM